MQNPSPPMGYLRKIYLLQERGKENTTISTLFLASTTNIVNHEDGCMTISSLCNVKWLPGGHIQLLRLPLLLNVSYQGYAQAVDFSNWKHELNSSFFIPNQEVGFLDQVGAYFGSQTTPPFKINCHPGSSSFFSQPQHSHILPAFLANWFHLLSGFLTLSRETVILHGKKNLAISKLIKRFRYAFSIILGAKMVFGV